MTTENRKESQDDASACQDRESNWDPYKAPLRQQPFRGEQEHRRPYGLVFIMIWWSPLTSNAHLNWVMAVDIESLSGPEH